MNAFDDDLRNSDDDAMMNGAIGEPAALLDTPGQQPPFPGMMTSRGGRGGPWAACTE